MTSSTKSPLSSEVRSPDWDGERGEKWRDHHRALEAMLAPVNAPLLDALQLDAPSRIVEVACGGGGTTLEILRRAPAGSTLDAFDISPALVEAARARVRGDDAVTFTVADMGRATPTHAYDRMVSRFGIMFFDDPPAAFGNLARWLVPGGRFALAVWGPPADNPSMMTAHRVVSELVDLPETDPAGPGPFRYADADALLALLEDAGFSGVEVHDWRGRIAVFGGMSPADTATFALDWFASFTDALHTEGESAVAEAHAELTRRYAASERDGVVEMVARVHLVTGTR